MPCLLSMAYSTDVAFVTVEDSFLHRLFIVERAHFTVVHRELFFTPDACFRLGLLAIAFQALDVGDLEPVELMITLWVLHILVHFIIVTNSTCPVFSFTYFVWALQLAFPQIVLAAEVTIFYIDFSACNVRG